MEAVVASRYVKCNVDAFYGPDNEFETDAETAARISGDFKRAEAELKATAIHAHRVSRLTEQVFNYAKTQAKEEIRIENARRAEAGEGKLTKRERERIEKKAHAKYSGKALTALVTSDTHHIFGMSHLDAQISAEVNMAYRALHDMMEELKPELLGANLKADIQADFMAALHGDKVKNSKFPMLAKVYKQVIFDLNRRYAHKTMDYEKYTHDTIIPTRVDPAILSKVSEEDWLDDARTYLSPAMSEKLRDEDLLAIYDAITEEGFVANQYGRSLGKEERTMGLHKSLNQAKFFEFKNSEAWLDFHKKYSAATPYSILTDHVSFLAKEVAMVDLMGPMPKEAFEMLAYNVENVIGKSGQKETRVARNSFANLSGVLNPYNRSFAEVSEAARNMTVAIKLPNVVLSALPDTIFGVATAGYLGMPRFRYSVGMLKHLFSGGKDHRALANRLGAPMQHMLDNTRVIARHADVQGGVLSARIADGVLRGGGLVHWTASMKDNFHFEFIQTYGTRKYDAEQKAAMKLYGITDDEIKRLEKSARFTQDGITYLDIDSVDDATRRMRVNGEEVTEEVIRELHKTHLPRGLRKKIMAMAYAESMYAVPEPDARTRGTLNQATQKGTVAGELFRAGTMFKGFLTVVMQKHWTRGWRGKGGNAQHRMAYFGQLMVGTLFFGTVSVALKEVAAGRTLPDMEDPEVLQNLLLEGWMAGGLSSLVGDLLFTDHQKYGNSLLDALSGPLLGEINRILFVGLLGNTQDAIMAEKELREILGEIGVGTLNRIPGQFWYLREALNRSFLDGLKEYADPDWARRQKQRELERMEEMGNEELFQ